MAEYVRAAGSQDSSVATMFALRTGTSDLQVDRDRPLRLDPALSRCRFCNHGEPEDARHVLTRCPAHAVARELLLAALPESMRALDDPQVFAALMGSADAAALCEANAALQLSVVYAVNAFWSAVRHYRAQGPPLEQGVLPDVDD